MSLLTRSEQQKARSIPSSCTLPGHAPVPALYSTMTTLDPIIGLHHLAHVAATLLPCQSPKGDTRLQSLLPRIQELQCF